MAPDLLRVFFILLLVFYFVFLVFFLGRPAKSTNYLMYVFLISGFFRPIAGFFPRADQKAQSWGTGVPSAR